MKPTPAPGRIRNRTPLRRFGRIAVWVLGIPAALLIILYLILLVTPIPLPFLRDQVRDAVLSSLSEESQLELGDMALAVEGGTWPVLRFAPVVFTDGKSGAKIRMEALEVGFSPVRALWGQPGATVTMVGPHIQINQDLFGPRLTSFDIVRDPQGGAPTVRIIEGLDAFPQIGIRSGGIEVEGQLPEGSSASMRSDNDWLLYNLEAAEKGMADTVAQAAAGRFSRLIIRDGILDMNDALYGVLRRFSGVNLDITPSPDGSVTKGTFSADFGGTVMQGSVERSIASDGTARLKSGVTNFDFAAVVPFINDKDAVVGMVGAGAVSIDVAYDAKTGKVVSGAFDIDMTGMDLRIQEDLFPIASSIMSIDWDPAESTFTMAEAGFRVGQTSAKMSGVFRLGLDELWGPTVGMSMRMRDVSIHPNDMAPPEQPFTSMEFSGWSAPLYGAMGIESFVAEKPGARLAAIGRIDMLRTGMGLDMEIGGEGITADDLKRLWPYILSGEARDWFVKNVKGGEIISSTMKYTFPVGSLAMDGEEAKPIPHNGVLIDIVAKDVAISPVDGMAPIALEGQTRLTMRDVDFTVSAAGATYPTAAGDIAFANAALVMSSETPGEQLVEISGDISGGIPSLVALIKEQQPGAIDPAKIPIDLGALAGQVDLGLVATIMLDKAGAMTDLDYAINGTVKDFGSTAPIEAHTFSNGQLSFSASQEGYRVAGQASVDGLAADIVIQGAGEAAPDILLSSTLDVADLKSMGFDVSEFLTGKVKFVARPMSDGSLQMAVDIADASLTIKDLGISKAVGVPGHLNAAIKQEGTLTELSSVSMAFGTVKLEGSLAYDSEKGLQSAEFSSFALSEGDIAQVSLTPIRGGYQLRLRGEQLDLKPMLSRFFKLGEGTGGPQATLVDQTIVVDAELTRALGFYRTTAFNLDMELTLKGTDMQKATLQASLGNDRSISVATNATPEGRTMSVAFNDLGTLLRLVGVYPNLEGGMGTLVMRYDTEAKTDTGTFAMQNFAIVDEENVADIVGNHRQSQDMIAAQNKLEFSNGQVTFIRRRDRIEITDGIVSGAQVGGTLRGFIYTDAKSYDLTGTYVPLFGFSRALQKLPLIGLLIAGEEGDGVFGVTFAVRGPLDSPDFQANPLSILAPGIFRRIFEYRARELPRVE